MRRWVQPVGATRQVLGVVRIGGAGVARLGRPGGLSAAGKKELWERWRAGEPISDIARALHKPPGSIHGMLEAAGGFSPPARRRRRCALTPAEREEISRGLATGESLRAIAARLGRCASTVCREVNRNGGRRRHRAQKAEEKAWERARRPKRCEEIDIERSQKGAPKTQSKDSSLSAFKRKRGLSWN